MASDMPGMQKWCSYDFTKACKAEPPYEPLGRPPANGEVFAHDAHGNLRKILDGSPYLPLVDNDWVRGKSLELEPSDIVVCTYPKCGTTWMQQILLLLLARGDSTQVTDVMKQAPWIEAHKPVRKEKPDVGDRFVWKTHSFATHLPWKTRPEGCKMILVTRNPFDAAVSLFHHTRDVPFFEYSGEWDHFLNELFLTGSTESGDFWQWHGEHYNEYLKNKDNTLWISYEEMKADLVGSVRKVAEFIGMGDVSDDLVEKVAELSDFSTMKKKFEEAMAVRQEKGEFVKKNHMREGKSGAWRKTFTEEQTAMMMEEHAKRSEKWGLPSDLWDCC